MLKVVSNGFPQPVVLRVPASSRKFPQVPASSTRIPTFPDVSRSFPQFSAGLQSLQSRGAFVPLFTPRSPIPRAFINSPCRHSVSLSLALPRSPSLFLPLPPSPSPPFLSPSAFLDFLGIIAGRAFHGIARSFHLIGADPRVGCGFLANSPGNTFSKILEAST